jgi:hypothetical protein
MPKRFTRHDRPPELEHEFDEVWRVIDWLQLMLPWLQRRIERLEEEAGIEPEPPPGLAPGGISPGIR